MLVPHGADAECVPGESALALEGNPEQKIGERVPRVGAVKGEIAAAARRVDGIRRVMPEGPACLEAMRAAHPTDGIGGFVLVVTEVNRAEGVSVKAEEARNSQSWKTGKSSALLHKTSDAGLHGVVGSQALRRVVKRRPHV